MSADLSSKPEILRTKRLRPDHVDVYDECVLASDYDALLKEFKTFKQAVLDPENQPSQYGTQLAVETSSVQAPIAAIRVYEDSQELLHLYAPGLPPGEYDLYCEPPAPNGQKVPFFGTSERSTVDQFKVGFLAAANIMDQEDGRGPEAVRRNAAEYRAALKTSGEPPFELPFHHDLCDAEDIEDCHGYEWVEGGQRGKCPCKCHAENGNG